MSFDNINNNNYFEGPLQVVILQFHWYKLIFATKYGYKCMVNVSCSINVGCCWTFPNRILLDLKVWSNNSKKNHNFSINKKWFDLYNFLVSRYLQVPNSKMITYYFENVRLQISDKVSIRL